ncbi:MAG: FtsX-like permease family protein [Clostridium lundense]|nr:FtsX-like permease family protein [Clostridium lundense]
MIINKKIKRTMLESKSQYLGSLVLIIISCLLFTMFNLLSYNLENLTSSFEKNYIQEDANFITNKKLINIPEIESKFNMKIEEVSSFDYSISKDKTLRVFSENTKINIPAIIRGETLSGNYILIDPSYAKANNLKIGDDIELYDKAFKISGFMSLPNYIYPLKEESDILTDSSSFGIAVITKADFTSLNRGNDSYSIKFNDGKNDIKNKISKFKDYLKSENIPILNWVNASANLRITFVSTKLSGINQISSSMPLAILLLTCMLASIVMLRMLKMESVIIGTLYALGYKKKQIKNHYLRYPLSIALTGGILGTILGVLALKPMIIFMVAYFNMPVGTISFSIKYISISIVLPIVFFGTAGYFVITKALKSSPLELMRGGGKNTNVSFIERNLKLDRFKFSTKFKIREQLRSISRSIFLLLGVVFATMLLLLGFASKSSLDYLMKDGFEQAFKYKYHYVFNAIQRGTPVNGEAFSESLFTLKSNDKISLAVYGISPNSQYITLEDKLGSKLSTDKVIITKPLADKLNVKQQDSITIVNKFDFSEYSITIDSIAESYVGNYIYMPLPKFNSMFKYPTNSYMGLWSKNELNIPKNQLLTTLTVDDMERALDSMTKPIQSTVGSIAFMSFIIGLIVIYVVTSMIIEENKETISLMKVLGYRKKEVYSMILNSSFFIVILGYILGIPLLLASLSNMFKSLTKDMSISFPIKINFSYLLIGFAVIYLTYELSKALSKRKINKVSMNEVLKSRLE